MAGRLAGRVALVIGAGSSGPGWGNGKAAAVLFAREGAAVTCVDLREDAAEETAGIIAEEGGTALAVTADVSDGEQVADCVAATLEAFGRIDVLHNNVGILALGGPAELASSSTSPRSPASGTRACPTSPTRRPRGR